PMALRLIMICSSWSLGYHLRRISICEGCSAHASRIRCRIWSSVRSSRCMQRANTLSTSSWRGLFLLFAIFGLSVRRDQLLHVLLSARKRLQVARPVLHVGGHELHRRILVRQLVLGELDALLHHGVERLAGSGNSGPHLSDLALQQLIAVVGLARGLLAGALPGGGLGRLRLGLAAAGRLCRAAALAVRGLGVVARWHHERLHERILH